jgi:hypothetical protein
MFTAIRRQQRSNGLAMVCRREFADNVRKAALIRATYRSERCGRRGFLELHHRGNRADNSLFKLRSPLPGLSQSRAPTPRGATVCRLSKVLPPTGRQEFHLERRMRARTSVRLKSGPKFGPKFRETA